MWRTFCLRGAGFPVHLLKTIHAPSSTTEFEMAAEQEHRTEGARQAAVEVCRRAEPEESAEHRRLRRRAKRKLKKGSIPDLVDQLPAIVDAVSQYAQQRAGLEELQMRVDQVFEQERVEISRGLHELCELASFREALVWQNRRAVETGLNVLARKKDDFRDTSQRPPVFRRVLLTRHQLTRGRLNHSG